MGGVGAADGLGAGLGQADVPHPAGGDQLGDRPDGVLDRDLRVHPTKTVDVEKLVVAHAVVVTGVEQADPGVQGGPDGGDALGLVGRAIGAGHPHAAQPDRRHPRTGGSQPSRDHITSHPS
jgi:hypothetical protein